MAVIYWELSLDGQEGGGEGYVVGVFFFTRYVYNLPQLANLNDKALSVPSLFSGEETDASPGIVSECTVYSSPVVRVCIGKHYLWTEVTLRGVT